MNNKYLRWYQTITARAQTRADVPSPCENHHIIPASLGGDESPSNLCALSLREHFICHLLLTKFTSGKDKTKMTYALWGMAHRNDVKLNSRLYDKLKSDFNEINRKSNVEKFGYEKAMEISKKISASSSGREHSDDTKLKMSESQKGKVTWNKGLTKENNLSIQKISNAHTGKRRSVESVEKQRKTITGNTRQPHTEISKQKNSESNKNRPCIVCPHCGKSAQQGNFNRWHGDNCKFLNSVVGS